MTSTDELVRAFATIGIDPADVNVVHGRYTPDVEEDAPVRFLEMVAAGCIWRPVDAPARFNVTIGAAGRIVKLPLPGPVTTQEFGSIAAFCGIIASPQPVLNPRGEYRVHSVLARRGSDELICRITETILKEVGCPSREATRSAREIAVLYAPKFNASMDLTPEVNATYTHLRALLPSDGVFLDMPKFKAPIDLTPEVKATYKYLRALPPSDDVFLAELDLYALRTKAMYYKIAELAQESPSPNTPMGFAVKELFAQYQAFNDLQDALYRVRGTMRIMGVRYPDMPVFPDFSS
jgi:hypothetical protein